MPPTHRKHRKTLHYTDANSKQRSMLSIVCSSTVRSVRRHFGIIIITPGLSHLLGSQHSQKETNHCRISRRPTSSWPGMIYCVCYLCGKWMWPLECVRLGHTETTVFDCDCDHISLRYPNFLPVLNFALAIAIRCCFFLGNFHTFHSFINKAKSAIGHDGSVDDFVRHTQCFSIVYTFDIRWFLRMCCNAIILLLTKIITDHTNQMTLLSSSETRMQIAPFKWQQQKWNKYVGQFPLDVWC